ncbi:MAG: RidA family protein [Thaumarchaeota archaeon]|nr:RidA family protein [Nitrososphaerota archaeon]
MKFIRPKGWAEPAIYSQGISAGNLIFLAGQTSTDEKGRPVGVGDMKAQAEQVFKRIKKLLEEAGAGMEDVVKLTTYVTDVQRYEAVRDVRARYFKGHKPTSTMVEVKGLANPEYLLEIEVVAVKK